MGGRWHGLVIRSAREGISHYVSISRPIDKERIVVIEDTQPVRLSLAKVRLGRKIGQRVMICDNSAAVR